MRAGRAWPTSAAMKRPILIHPDPRLKKRCTEVEDVSDEIRALADDMRNAIYSMLD